MRIEMLYFAAAAVLFAIFSVNVLLGAARQTVFLNDVAEMLVLFASCIFFVIAVLLLERKRNVSGNSLSQNGGETI